MLTRQQAIKALVDNRETIFNYKMEQVDEYTSIGLVTRSDEGRQYRLALELVDKIYDEHEAQLKAKDEEIERLNCRAYHAEGYISDLHNHPNDKKFLDRKARSIVAMLFWKAKRQKKVFQKYYEEYGRNHSLTQNYRGMYEQAIMDFRKSHKMLKDNA